MQMRINEGIMGPPINVTATVLNHWTPRIAAHELGHSTCVWHHGEAPWAKTTIYSPESSAAYNNRASAAIRTSYRYWTGSPPLYLCGHRLPHDFRFHPKGSQQSGDVNCVMKYCRFFEVFSDAGMFGCWPRDPDGAAFCTFSTGTGYNSGGLVGGNANRGNCLGQMRVNDK